MTNGRKLLLTYPNLFVCALYFDINFLYLINKFILFVSNKYL